MIPVRGGRTARLVLEPLDERHADGLVAALDHPDVGRFIGGPDVTTVAALCDRIERLRQGPGRDGEQWCNWVAVADGSVVGRVEATLHDGIAEIAYVFGPAYGGRGLATEATAWMIHELAAQGIDECWATVVPDNTASIRLLARLGFETASPDGMALQSFDAGDLVFRRSSAR